jgi:hypothetical protein
MIKFKTYICTSGRSFIFVFEFLDEGDMWSVDGKKPEETGLFEKHNFEVSLCQKKQGNIMYFSIGPLSIVLAI